jgi:hypothetical protein
VAREKPAIRSATYVNTTRTGLPARTPISGIADRILAIAEQVILQNGGTKREVPGKEVEYVIKNDL